LFFLKLWKKFYTSETLDLFIDKNLFLDFQREL